MRSAMALAALLAVAACAGNTLEIDNGGDPLDAGVQPAPHDLAPNLHDLFPPRFDLPREPKFGCADLLACEKACTTQACATKCEALATPNAIKLYQVLEDCFNQACASGGNGPCSGADQQACNDCTDECTTGTSASGTTNGPCVDSSSKPSTSATCGACLDPFIACENDLTM
jgi:hypothetical protein